MPIRRGQHTPARTRGAGLTIVDGLSLTPLDRRVRGRLRSLPVDPFPDVRRTVSEFDALTFAEYQEVHCSAVDQADLVEIDDNDPAFLIDGAAKDVHVVPCNPPADPQDHNVFFS
jgi:hypothetical protein